jgi:hypothetical protein
MPLNVILPRQHILPIHISWAFNFFNKLAFVCIELFRVNFVLHLAFILVTYNVSRATRSLGFGERDVLSSTNVAKVHNVSIKHNTQIFGARCYKLYAAICSGQIIL